MIPNPIRKFIYDLIDATNNGDISWNEGASEAYYCNHKNYSLHISHHFNQDIEVGSYYMNIAREGSDTRFSVSDNEGEDDIMAMRNLYQAVTLNSSGLQDIGDDFFD